MREPRFSRLLQMLGEGTVGPADSLADQGYLLFRRKKKRLSQQIVKGSHTYTHTHAHANTHAHAQTQTSDCFIFLYARMLSHRLTRTSAHHQRLNRLLAGTPLRKQRPNYHHILHQGHLMTAHSHSSIHFTCKNHILPSYKAIRL